MKKLTGIFFIIVVAIAAAIGIGIYNTPTNRINRHLDLGQRYLDEQNYELAIVEFDKVIEIDPMAAEAYLGKAQAYKSIGDLDKMLEALQDGYKQTEDERIKLQLIASIPTFKIEDVKVLGYNLLEPHFKEVVEAAGYLSYLQEGKWIGESLQNGEGTVHMADQYVREDWNDVEDSIALGVPIPSGGSCFVFSYGSTYDKNTDNIDVWMYLSKHNGNEPDTLRLGESWCDLPIYVGDSYDKWCAQMGVNAIIESPFTEITESEEIDEYYKCNYICRNYSILENNDQEKNEMVNYEECEYQKIIRSSEYKGENEYAYGFDYNKSAELRVYIENRSKIFTVRAYFLDETIQAVYYEICILSESE